MIGRGQASAASRDPQHGQRRRSAPSLRHNAVGSAVPTSVRHRVTTVGGQVHMPPQVVGDGGRARAVQGDVDRRVAAFEAVSHEADDAEDRGRIRGQRGIGERGVDHADRCRGSHGP